MLCIYFAHNILHRRGMGRGGVIGELLPVAGFSNLNKYSLNKFLRSEVTENNSSLRNKELGTFW